MLKNLDIEIYILDLIIAVQNANFHLLLLMLIRDFYYGEQIWLDNKNLKINLLERIPVHSRRRQVTLSIIYNL